MRYDDKVRNAESQWRKTVLSRVLKEEKRIDSGALDGSRVLKGELEIWWIAFGRGEGRIEDSIKSGEAYEDAKRNRKAGRPVMCGPARNGQSTTGWLIYKYSGKLVECETKEYSLPQYLHLHAFPSTGLIFYTNLAFWGRNVLLCSL